MGWDLEKALSIGTLPEIYLKPYGPELLNNYIDVYLWEEIQMEALTRNIESYARFLDLAAESSGQIVNYSKMAADSEIPKETLRRFFQILEDTLLVHSLKGFRKTHSSRRPVQKQNYIFFDLGVRNAVLKQHRNVFSDTQKGSLFEQWFILQIIIWRHFSQTECELCYYRDDKGNEVDLIIERDDKLIAIEIKYGTQYKHEHIKSLKFFEKVVDKPIRCIVVYRGKEKQLHEGIEIFPYQSFLDELLDDA